MKIEITQPCIGTPELRHLDAGEVVDLAPKDAAPLVQAGKARLVRNEDQAELVAQMKRDDTKAFNLAGGRFL